MVNTQWKYDIIEAIAPGRNEFGTAGLSNLAAKLVRYGPYTWTGVAKGKGLQLNLYQIRPLVSSIVKLF